MRMRLQLQMQLQMHSSEEQIFHRGLVGGKEKRQLRTPTPSQLRFKKPYEVDHSLVGV